MQRKVELMDGNQAAAYISYAFTEVAGIFPITPSSPMAEHVDEWAANGKKNLFGQPVKGPAVQRRALALVIGGVGAAPAAALVGRKPQPGQVGFQQVGKGAGAAGGVQVLDAQHHPAAPAFGRQPGQQAAAQVAQVHPPAGAGGIAAHRHWGLSSV